MGKKPVYFICVLWQHIFFMHTSWQKNSLRVNIFRKITQFETI